MLKFQIKTKKDLREEAKIERRRQQEGERKGRIFNERKRILGIDCQMLEAQIAEKERLKEMNAEIERKFFDVQKQQDEIIRIKRMEFEKERRKVQAEIDFFRSNLQRKEERREYDLYDPDALKKSKPARTSDKDPNLGISSAQIFSGEDLTKLNRCKTQKDLQKEWLMEQLNERKMNDEALKCTEKKFQEMILSQDRKALELEYAERNKRKQKLNEVLDYNKNLAAQQEDQRLRSKQIDEKDNRAEIYNHLTCDMLTENPCTAQSPLGPHKKIAYMYRGMSPEELQQFRLEQKSQIEENNRKRYEETRIENQWNEMTANSTRAFKLKEIERDRQTRSMIKELFQDNTRLAAEQKFRKNFTETVLYTNKPSDDYFAQFNTSTR